MKTNRLFFLVLLASCTVQHDIGHDTNQNAVTCGGVAQLPCASGYVCVDDPNDACDPSQGGADCSGLCATLRGSCGGLAGTACPSSQTCVDDPRDSCDPTHGGADCPGVCVTFEPTDAGTGHDDGGTCGADPCGACAQGTTPNDTCSGGTWSCQCLTSIPCGGLSGIACPNNQACVDNPNDGCDPNHGGADCPGLCVAAPPDAGTPTGGHCGGLAGTVCPGGQDCVDDPSDNCDPLHGGADCPGICVDNASCGADPCGACPSGTAAHDTCSGGAWQCACLPTCQKTNPDECNICPAGLMALVNVGGQCVCECQVAAATQCTQDTDCKKSNPDVCNICTAPLNTLVCKMGACTCGCQ
jgi:hypothetical protein